MEAGRHQKVGMATIRLNIKPPPVQFVPFSLSLWNASHLRVSSLCPSSRGPRRGEAPAQTSSSARPLRPPRTRTQGRCRRSLRSRHQRSQWSSRCPPRRPCRSSSSPPPSLNAARRSLVSLMHNTPHTPIARALTQCHDATAKKNKTAASIITGSWKTTFPDSTINSVGKKK